MVDKKENRSINKRADIDNLYIAKDYGHFLSNYENHLQSKYCLRQYLNSMRY